MVFYFSYFNIHKKLKKKFKYPSDKQLMGHSKTSNYPTHPLIFFMEGHNNLMSASPMLMWRPDISLKKTIIRSHGSTSDKW